MSLLRFPAPLPDKALQNECFELRPSFGPDGLVAAIAQDESNGEVLMLAWMNEEALRMTLQTGRAVYWSRSRRRLWRKGEESGHEQEVCSVCVDCDQDAILLKVRQKGVACHTGRKSCFYRLAAGDGTLDERP